MAVERPRQCAGGASATRHHCPPHQTGPSCHSSRNNEGGCISCAGSGCVFGTLPCGRNGVVTATGMAGYLPQPLSAGSLWPLLRNLITVAVNGRSKPIGSTSDATSSNATILDMITSLDPPVATLT